MRDRNLRFVQAFEEIKAEVNRLAGAGGVQFELDAALKRHPWLRRSERLLRHVRDVRNALQHPNHSAAAPAFKISAGFLEETQSLLQFIRRPPVASAICVPRKSLYVAAQDDPIGKVADEMRAKSYSHVPILDDSDIVIGVFNEAAIFDYFWSDDVIDASRGLRISDIMRHCSLDAAHTERFTFARPDQPAEKIADVFSKVRMSGTRVGAVFVTPSGKPDERVVGMITPWDILAPWRH